MSKRPGLYVAVSTHLPMSRLCLEGTPEAFKLWVVGLCLAREEQRAGDVTPRGAARMAGVDMTAAEELVRLGAWHRPGEGCGRCPEPAAGRVQIHAYANWQDTAEEIAARSDAGRNAARMRWASEPDSDSHADGNANRIQNKNKNKNSPSERAVRSSNSPSRNGNRGATAAPVSLWPPSEAMRRWAQERNLDNDHWLEEETDSFLNWARSKNKRFSDWEAAWKNWVRRSAESSGWAGGKPTSVTEQEVEALVDALLWTHPCPHPEELDTLMADDPAAYEEAMRPRRAQWREHARTQVLAEQEGKR